MNTNKSITEAITVEDLSCWRRRLQGGVLQILDHVNFSIPTGRIVTLVGPSGCGKSTILNILSGLLTHKTSGVQLEGRVCVAGCMPDEARRRRMFGFCFQRPSLLPWRSTTQNIQLPLELAGIKKNERNKRTSELLEMIHLTAFAHYKTGELSGGMQHRVSLARSLALEPPILLLDEPFSSIDEPMREKLNIELLHICQKTQKTVVYVTHNLSEAILLGSQVFILSRLPATVLKVMEIELPDRSPKAITSSAFIQYLKVAREILEKTY